MWKELFKIAPELIPVIIQTVMDLEQVVTGAKKGEIKKSKVMNVIKSILDTKDYFLGKDSDGQNLILNLVDGFVDSIVSTFNYTGLFKSSEKLDFTPIPLNQEDNNDSA